MQVIINGESHQITGTLSLAQAVALLTSWRPAWRPH